MSLNPKQTRFVQAYLVDPNATKAARKAGYSAKTAYSIGQRLLKHVEISAEVGKGQERLAVQSNITATEVIEGLKREATLYGEDASHSARVAAWSALGKHLGMFTDRHELTGKDGLPPFSFTLNLGDAAIHEGDEE